LVATGDVLAGAVDEDVLGDEFLGVRDTAGLENPQVAADDDVVRLRLGAVLHRETAVHGSPTGPGSMYRWIPAD
jgi:hypothetical protein